MTADQTSQLHTSLLHTLFSIINEGDVGDSNYILAHHFLQNYSQLQNLNIFDVATECFVSRSSVRRFCKAIGYENFMDLKHEFARYDQVYYENIKYSMQENYQQLLSFEINKMIQDLSSNLKSEIVDVLTESIHESRYTVFLTPGAYVGVIKDFQEKMIAHQRIIYLISENYTVNDLLRSLSDKDVLVTLSTSGVFAEEASKFTKQLGGKKILLTCNQGLNLDDYYDYSYCLSSLSQEELHVPVYSKYGTMFMLDILYSEFVKKFKSSYRGI